MNDITALSPVKPEMLASLKLSAMNLAEGEMMSFEPAVFLALVEALEKAQQRIAELERMESALRPVGVMSQAAYHRLDNRESRFIALWPRPEIYLPRKRPDDGVIVYARTAGIQVIEGEGQ